MTIDALINKLSKVLKQSGETILNGESKLCLTSHSLRVLGNAFRAIRSDDDLELSFDTLPTLSQGVHHNVHFLYDFSQKTIALKILGIKNSACNENEVDISVFHSLRVLEVKKFLLDRVTGLHRLRPQIHTLICTRSARTVEEVFELCGGDQSGPMAWSTLKTACLSHNQLRMLDESLLLTELEYLNLGYNCLEQLPRLCLSSHTKLRVLILRNNQLEHLHGLHELRGLRELDLAYNTICVHSSLEPLSHLSKLKTLNLVGNPVCYHAKHRNLTIKHIHRQAIKNLKLDGVSVTEKEQAYCGLSSSLTIDSYQRSRLEASTNEGYSSQERSYAEYSSTTHDDDIIIKPINKKKSRRPRKARRPEISDVDSDGPLLTGSYGSTPGTTPDVTHHHLTGKKNQMEHMRSELGNDWLQTLTAKDTLNTKTNQAIKAATAKIASEDDLYLKEQSTIANPEPDRTPETNSGKSSPSSTNTITKGLPVNDQDKPCSTSTCLEKNGATQISDSKSRESDDECVTLIEHDLQKKFDDDRGRKEDAKLNNRIESPNMDGFYSTQTDNNDAEDFGMESEPFIVSLSQEPCHQFLLSISQRFLVEKDLEGVVMETLDLHSLLTVEEHFSEGKEPEIRLTFDYMRKDRRERNYVMEDINSTQLLVELLQPALKIRAEKELSKNSFQCLKCSHIFKGYRESVSTNVAEMPLCPNCQGNKVIEILLEKSNKRPTKLKGDVIPSPLAQSTPFRPNTEKSHPEVKLGHSSSATMLHDRFQERLDQLSNSIPKTDYISGPGNSASSSRRPRQSSCASAGSDIQVLEPPPPHNQLLVESSDEYQSSYFSVNTANTLRDSDFESPRDYSENNSFHSFEMSHSNDHTPCGSLSNRTITAMVTSVYESSQHSPAHLSPNVNAVVGSAADSDAGISFVAHSYHSDCGNLSHTPSTNLARSDKTPATVTAENEEQMNEDEVAFLNFKLDYQDYRKVDHRLKLHLMLVLKDDEDLSFIVKCDCVILGGGDEFPCLLSVSDSRLHVLTLTAGSSSDLTDSLELAYIVSLVDICAVYLGLGEQYVTIISDEVALSVLFRDTQRCRRFYKLFTAKVQETTFSSHSKLETVSKNDPTTTSNLTLALRSQGDSELSEDVRSFTLCFLHSGDIKGSHHRSAAALVVTSTHICVADIDWGWPVTERDGKTTQATKFTMKDCQLITDLTQLETGKHSATSIILRFTDESSCEQSQWVVSMETFREAKVVTNIIKEIWESEFGVDLQVI